MSLSTSRPVLAASRTLLVKKVIQEETEEREVNENPYDERPRASSVLSVQVLESATGFDTDLECEEEDRKGFAGRGIDIYNETCKKLGVVPISYFIRHMQSPVLNLRHHGIGPLGARAISIPLVSNTYVMNLDLEDNWIDHNGATCIAEMLRENCYISHLSLANNNIGTHGAKILCDVLSTSTVLTHVDLSGNSFHDNDGKLFAHIILETGTIQHLNLSHNSFGVHSGEVMGHGIGENETLELIDLSWNMFRGVSFRKLVDGIQVNSRLKRVNLAWNAMGAEGALALQHCLENNSILTELDVSSNRASFQNIVTMCKGLETNESLTLLKAGKNQFGYDGAMVVLKAIINDRSVLTVLDLTDSWVTKEFEEIMLELKQSKPELQVKIAGVIGKYVITGSYNKDKVTLMDRLTRGNEWGIIKQHFEANNIVMIDLFKHLEKSKKEKITSLAFKDILLTSKVVLTPQQIAILLERLDDLTDGQRKLKYKDIITRATQSW